MNYKCQRNLLNPDNICKLYMCNHTDKPYNKCCNVCFKKDDCEFLCDDLIEEEI